MKALRRFLRRLSVSAARRHDEARLREELESHLQMQAADNERRGMSPGDARRQAVLRLGSIEAIRGSHRDEQGLGPFDDLLQDVRYTFRQLRKSPIFTLTATLSLAMGIGANAAVFTIAERVLLRPLPVPRPHELVQIADERILTQPSPRFSYPFYTLLRDNDALSGTAARFALGLTIGLGDRTVRADGELVSGNYFEVLGVPAEHGRSLAAADDRTPGAHPVAVISERFWRQAFDADPSAIGRQVLVTDHPFAIVGVASKRFTGTQLGGSTDVWIPLAMQREAGRDLIAEARTNWLEIIGRLRPGETRERTADALNRHLQQRASELPAQTPSRLLVLLPGDKGSAPMRQELQSALLMLFALTGLALALACVNVACLAAVRSTAREKELAIRLALGAGRTRLVRQLLTEGIVLAMLGGIAGVMVSPWLARWLAVLRSTPLHIDATLEPRVLGFVMLVSLLTGVMVALLPIATARRVRLAPTAERPMGAGPGSRRITAHDAAVAVQIAMALAMLISSALLVQSVRSLRSVNPGFRTDGLLLVSLDAAAAGYDANRIDGFWRATLEEVRRIPGVERVSLARTVPLAPGRQRHPWVNPATGEKIEIDTNFVGPSYFETLGVPLIAGRDFSDADVRSSTPAIVVNERLAQMFWPQQDVIGRTIRLPDGGKPIAHVVGLVRDVKYRDLRGDAGPMIYRPVLQTRSTDAMTLHVRAGGDPTALVNGVRRAVQSVNRNVPLFRITTLEAQFDASFGQTRQAALLTGAFGVLALLLSGVGVYGVTALAVSRRTRDIGIRMALGARRTDIARAIGGRAIVLVAAGLALGVCGSLAFTRVTGTFLFAITPADTVTFAVMSAVLAGVCVVAFAIPMQRAMRLDALAAIRHE